MKVKIYTDGSCLGNPGRGGWAFVAKYIYGSEKEHVNSGPHKGETTNVSMELVAIREALGRMNMREFTDVEIVTDSQQAINWLTGQWQRRAPNVIELCGQIDKLVTQYKSVTFTYVKGHDTDPTNNKVDKLARNAASKGEL